MTNALQTASSEKFQLSATTLKELGLQDSDAGDVRQVAQKIQPSNPASVSEFGRAVAEHTSRYADSLLDQVRNRDLDEAGVKLTQVVNIARSLNVGPLSDKRSRLPVIGPLLDKFRLRTSNLMSQFDTTRSQIEALIEEVKTTQTNIQQRNAGLEDMFSSVRDEHRLLGIHIAAGRLRLDELRELAQEQRSDIGNDPGRVQALSDLDAVIANLDKRIGDLVALQHSAMQSLPTIRMVQAANTMLVDKFHTIREITVPAWKRQFMLSLTLNEQKNAVQLATHIDNTTNDLLKRNAELLHRNSVETAKANQRLVIDVETLKDVQNTLIKTVEDVIKIQQSGVDQRKNAERQIEAMRADLRARLTRNPGKEQIASEVTDERI
ncbi:toxic anion resistance protein [Acidovorax sp. sif1233]|jgi:uncharacterized protein YaaN involved in tellurite resistance|uniref:toxic anion resistance protein n=1 Tax=unclassified Acidovorax TaxID=2684926 RepID=UPI000EF9FF66|nr:MULTISPECIES: toxic anion resistance protein [unclassified Acidovorax]MBV7457670.1 toxic anion resistance protein [Acidovorax sp. sif1233]RMA56490.1 uncharacterized protein YaaN involved in tellurite resistance [Acidovorax sp. 100]